MLFTQDALRSSPPPHIRAKAAPNEGVKNKLKKVASKILEAIDKLLAFLQRKADS